MASRIANDDFDISEFPLSKVFTKSFLLKHCEYESIEEMASDCGINLLSSSDLDSPIWEDFVKANTKFASWRDMYLEALDEYAHELCDQVEHDLHSPRKQ